MQRHFSAEVGHNTITFVRKHIGLIRGGREMGWVDGLEKGDSGRKTS